jgi:hypothetical protein
MESDEPVVAPIASFLCEAGRYDRARPPPPSTPNITFEPALELVADKVLPVSRWCKIVRLYHEFLGFDMRAALFHYHWYLWKTNGPEKKTENCIEYHERPRK